MQKIFDKHAESVKDPDIISRIKITKSEYAYFYLSRIIEEVSKKRKLSKEVLKLLVKYPIFVVKYFWNHAKKTFNGRKSS
jgi:thermostable 8-oxoguanine DNA glycosylase